MFSSTTPAPALPPFRWRTSSRALFAKADRMFGALTACMRDALAVPRTETYDLDVEVPSWAA